VLLLVSFGFSWIFQVSLLVSPGPGFPWFPLDSPGFPWFLLVSSWFILGFFLLFHSFPPGLSWNLRVSHSFLRFLLVFLGFFWFVLVFLLVSFGFYGFPHGFPWFLLVFLGFLLISLGFSWFLLVSHSLPPGFSCLIMVSPILA